MVTMYNALFLDRLKRAACELANKLWVAGRAAIRGQFFPHNSAATCFFSAVNRQKNGELKEQQINILIFWIGELEGRFWGGWVCLGFPPKHLT
eukprot:scaffold56460_cov17-Tisochrysis_lutea.AAC.1